MLKIIYLSNHLAFSKIYSASMTQEILFNSKNFPLLFEPQ